MLPASRGRKVVDLLQGEIVDLHVGYEEGTPLGVDPEEAVRVWLAVWCLDAQKDHPSGHTVRGCTPLHAIAHAGGASRRAQPQGAGRDGRSNPKSSQRCGGACRAAILRPCRRSSGTAKIRVILRDKDPDRYGCL